MPLNRKHHNTLFGRPPLSLQAALKLMSTYLSHSGLRKHLVPACWALQMGGRQSDLHLVAGIDLGCDKVPPHHRVAERLVAEPADGQARHLPDARREHL